MSSANTPIFWRHSQLPYIELRRIEDGRRVCYAPHTHKQWSMGLILKGQSRYQIQKLKGEGRGEHNHTIQQGSMVFMNPDQVHACSALDGQPWSYVMFYLDCEWLARLSRHLGLQQDTVWRDIPVNLLEDPGLFARVQSLAECLIACGSEGNIRHLEAETENILSEVLQALAACTEDRSVEFSDALTSEPVVCAVAKVAYQLDQCPEQPLPLEQMSRTAGITPTQLIRAFKKYYGLTPHAYQINRRVQLGQQALKQGQAIVDVALGAGFADQPHFQRVFKKILQATPNQYRIR
ncbi:helix-turn-helix domain-containing protein [Oceanospirillum sp.]|uniref:helix-turn-helix domain-containing protein n=1 Tax=Oceanospirillum sp. TaxID=2021254 RepID=UPI003A91A6B7